MRIQPPAFGAHAATTGAVPRGPSTPSCIHPSANWPTELANWLLAVCSFVRKGAAGQFRGAPLATVLRGTGNGGPGRADREPGPMAPIT